MKNVWDIAAGVLIVEEAGGKISDIWGNEYSLMTRNLVSSNGNIHEELRDYLIQAEMWMSSEGGKVTSEQL